MKNEANTAVIIVNYNTGPFLGDCLQSCLYSSVPLHIIVVDNHSDDDSLTQAKQVQGSDHYIEFIKNDQNVGFSTAINQASNLVNEDYIMLLNPDCTVYKDTFLRLELFMHNYPDAGIAGVLVFNTDGSEQRGCRRRDPTLTRSIITLLKLDRFFQGIDIIDDILSDTPVEVDAVSGSAMMIRKSSFDKVGGMDETFFYIVRIWIFVALLGFIKKKFIFVHMFLSSIVKVDHLRILQ